MGSDFVPSSLYVIGCELRAARGRIEVKHLGVYRILGVGHLSGGGSVTE